MRCNKRFAGKQITTTANTTTVLNTMNKTLTILLITVATLSVISCKKWVDPAPTTDPRINNPYCNDPEAVNYNWGFPGVPDNTLCFFPSDIFNGTYLFVDSVYQASTGFFILTQTQTLQVVKRSQSKLEVFGLCGTGSLFITAHSNFIATIDTTVGDTTIFNRGQLLCRTQDTAAGTITYNRIDSLLHISIIVVSDTGITTHTGKARKI